MIQAIDFIRQPPRPKAAEMVSKLYRLTRQRAEWVAQFAGRKGITQSEVISAGIDELIRLDKECNQVDLP